MNSKLLNGALLTCLVMATPAQAGWLQDAWQSICRIKDEVVEQAQKHPRITCLAVAATAITVGSVVYAFWPKGSTATKPNATNPFRHTGDAHTIVMKKPVQEQPQHRAQTPPPTATNTKNATVKVVQPQQPQPQPQQQQQQQQVVVTNTQQPQQQVVVVNGTPADLQQSYVSPQVPQQTRVLVPGTQVDLNASYNPNRDIPVQPQTTATTGTPVQRNAFQDATHNLGNALGVVNDAFQSPTAQRLGHELKGAANIVGQQTAIATNAAVTLAQQQYNDPYSRLNALGRAVTGPFGMVGGMVWYGGRDLLHKLW